MQIELRFLMLDANNLNKVVTDPKVEDGIANILYHLGYRGQVVNLKGNETEIKDSNTEEEWDNV